MSVSEDSSNSSHDGKMSMVRHNTKSKHENPESSNAKPYSTLAPIEILPAPKQVHKGSLLSAFQPGLSSKPKELSEDVLLPSPNHRPTTTTRPVPAPRLVPVPKHLLINKTVSTLSTVNSEANQEGGPCTTSMSNNVRELDSVFSCNQCINPFNIAYICEDGKKNWPVTVNHFNCKLCLLTVTFVHKSNITQHIEQKYLNSNRLVVCHPYKILPCRKTHIEK